MRGMTEEPIFHIAERRLWEQSQATGEYAQSTRGATLADEGFIHCSFQHQVDMVANFLYADHDGDLVLLEADPARIAAEIRVENLDGGEEQFPHIYGPLPVSAVVRVHSMTRDSAGWHSPVAT
jgi:uncharacterized protein (DUF952 family)